MLIRCKNCKAKFDQSEPVCPYCGTMNYIGSEEQYLDKLDDIKEDLSQIPDQQKAYYKKEAKKERKRTLKIIFVVAMIIASYYGFLKIKDSFDRNPQTTTQDFKERKEFEAIIYPKLDQLYEQEKYTKILEIIHDETYTQMESSVITSWEHMDFMMIYSDYYEVIQAKDKWINSDEFYYGDLANAISGLYFFEKGLEHQNIQEYPQHQQDLIKQYDHEIQSYLYNDMKLSKDEIQTIFQIEDSEKLFKTIYDFAETFMEEQN